MLRFIQILIVITLFASCKQQNLTYVVYESFVSNPFDFELNPKALQKNFNGYFKLIDEPIENIYVKGNIDTLVKLISSAGQIDYFMFYKVYDNRLIFTEAKIKTDQIQFKDGVKVGMSKTLFEKQFRIKTLANTYSICNQEGTNQWLFYFSKSVLDSVEYQGYLD